MTKKAAKPNTLPMVREEIYEGRCVSVRLWALDCENPQKLQTVDADAREYFRVSVTGSGINTTDLPAVVEFATALLNAVARARQLNAERGL